MAKYYVNDLPQRSGAHEVITDVCKFFNQIRSKTYLGEFENCSAALPAAKAIYEKAEACTYCSNSCHRR